MATKAKKAKAQQQKETDDAESHVQALDTTVGDVDDDEACFQDIDLLQNHGIVSKFFLAKQIDEVSYFILICFVYRMWRILKSWRRLESVLSKGFWCVQKRNCVTLKDCLRLKWRRLRKLARNLTVEVFSRLCSFVTRGRMSSALLLDPKIWSKFYLEFRTLFNHLKNNLSNGCCNKNKPHVLSLVFQQTAWRWDWVYGHYGSIWRVPNWKDSVIPHFVCLVPNPWSEWISRRKGHFHRHGEYFVSFKRDFHYVINLKMTQVNLWFLKHFSRPDRLKDIADRFSLDQNAVLDNVLYARAYTSEHQFELLDLVAGKCHEEAGVYKLLVWNHLTLFWTCFSVRSW